MNKLFYKNKMHIKKRYFHPDKHLSFLNEYFFLIPTLKSNNSI